MPLYNVHSAPLLIKYSCYLCSKATLFYILTTLVTFVPPLLIAYRSEGFWKKLDWYAEQPNVHFKQQLIVLIEMVEDGEYIAWSTYDNLNQLLEGHIEIPLVQFREEDTNGDGLNDLLDLSLQVLPGNSTVVSVTLMLFFDYQLSRFCRLEMEGMAYVQQSSALGGLELQFYGDLAIDQRTPLPHAGIDVQYNTSIVDSDSVYASAYDIGNILKSYSSRNVTTILRDVYSTWKTGRGPDQPFTIQTIIRYPEQLILYRTGFWQMMKFAWMQYASIMVVFALVFRYVKTYVFQNQIITTMTKNPVKFHRS